MLHEWVACELFRNMPVKTITHMFAKRRTLQPAKNLRSISLRGFCVQFFFVAYALFFNGLQSKCAGQTVEFNRIGQCPGYARGQVYALSVSGNYAYVANAVYGAGLQIVNISNPAAPI